MMKLAANFILIAISFLYCFPAVAESANLRTFSAQYGPFNLSYYGIFEVIRPALISNDALQLTPDYSTSEQDMIMTYNSARILLKQPFRLWDDRSSQPKVASFNTSFLFNVYRFRNDNTTGEGLAFLIAPDLLLPPNSFGQFLGLTNSMTDKSDSNKLIAVEFNTFKQYFDPDNNHVGIDVNSVRSIKTESLTPHNITIAPIGARFYNVWVDYDGLNKVLDVYRRTGRERRSNPTQA
ncbi:UNVERIFIED_CONTAM: Lectin-related protein [Sesamum radiatum]|uniref:Lectin-related protein n=1 Tax=Sesamum radiatum TaxID=300843 RepID=A0AAW2VRY7_SESRA